MDATDPVRQYSTRLPIVIGAIVTLGWICVPVMAVILPMLVAAPNMAMAMEAERTESAGPAGSASRRVSGVVMPAIHGEPAVLAERLRAVGFEDDPDMDGRLRSRAFGAWIAALRYDGETSGCTVLLEGTTSTTVEFAEIVATFNERVGAREIARVLGPVLSVLDPGADPTMIVAVTHDGSGAIGRWDAERRPREGGGMAVVLVAGHAPPTIGR